MGLIICYDLGTAISTGNIGNCFENTLSNSELQAGSETSGSRSELQVEIEILEISKFVITQTVIRTTTQMIMIYQTLRLR